MQIVFKSQSKIHNIEVSDRKEEREEINSKPLFGEMQHIFFFFASLHDFKTHIFHGEIKSPAQIAHVPTCRLCILSQNWNASSTENREVISA